MPIRPIALLLSALVLWHASVASAAPQKKIKIGVSTALTGEGATWGLDVRDGIAFAVEELAPERFELIVEDDKCSSKDAASVAHKLVEVDKVDYVVGLACSSAALASAPIYERARTVTIVVSGSSPKIAQAGDYI